MDLSKRQRHTHRSIARSRADGQTEQGLSRSETMDVLRRASRNQRLGLDEGPGYEASFSEASEQASEQSTPALFWLAETIEEQASGSTEITAQLRDVLNQCLLMTIANTESIFDPPRLATPAQSPEELLRALARIVASHSGDKTGLSSAGGSGLLEQERQNAAVSFESTPEPDAVPAPGAPDVRSRRLLEPPLQTVAALIKRHRQRFVPAVTVTSDGLRLEEFEDGAEIIKDALGRVLEIHSTVGESLSLHYDDDGNLESFYRRDSRGHDHSICKRDKHGVVVRDPDGRARAAGESMTVDPHGCLSVHNHDGQMVSVDLVRGLHIERRRLADRSGHLSTVTAVFAHDGFRMATHFHEVILTEAYLPQSFNGRKVSPLRFYGRDGSAVEFASEEELLAVRPDRVFPPASFLVDHAWRGKRQARTAWEAVQEYLELLL